MSSDFASPIFQWLNANPELAGIATFIISAGESVAIVGTIVPGSVMMTAIGALIGAGIIPFWPTMIWAILGAIIGDGISYWVGHYFKDRLHDIWPFKKHPQVLKKGENFFLKYGGMSVFIGRFVGPVRALVPLVAGMLGMKPLRFTIANVASAIGWAPLYMLPGILLGAASLEVPSEVGVRIILVLLFSFLFVILCLWIIKKIFDLIRLQINEFLTWLWNNLKKSRYSYFLTHFLKHHDRNKLHGQLGLALLFIFTAFLFLYLAADVLIYGPKAFIINNIIFHVARSLRSATLDTGMIIFTLLGDKSVLLPLILVLFGYFYIKKQRHTAWHVLVLGIITAGSVELFKYLVHSPRPWGVIGTNASITDFSFPSGHTTLAFTFYLAITLFFVKTYQLKHAKILYFLTGTFIALIALSRLYFGVHWFTDVLGAIILSSAILMLMTISYNRKKEIITQPLQIIATLVLTLIFLFSIAFYHSFYKLKNTYGMLDWPLETISLQTWWQEKNSAIPLFRINRYGYKSNIFNIQWLGNIDEIKDILLKNDWAVPPPSNWLRIFYRITSVKSTEHLPLIPSLYLDKPPVLVLVKYYNNNLIILRLWNSHIIIEHLQEPLWLGSVEFAPSTYSWLFKNRRSNSTPITPELLFPRLSDQYEIKQLVVKVNRHQLSETKILRIRSKKLMHSLYYHSNQLENQSQFAT